MITQLNKPLSLAVLRTRNGEIPGYEDLYMLTAQNTMQDIRSAVKDSQTARNIFCAVYRDVWNRHARIPEPGIVRSWIRVIIRDCTKQMTDMIIEEFPVETDTEPLKDVDGAFTTALIEIEDSLGILRLPEALEVRRKRGGMPAAVARLLVSIAAVGGAACVVFLVARFAGEKVREIGSQAPVVEVIDTAETLPEEEKPVHVSNGWQSTDKGRRYRFESGIYAADCWLEEEDALYCFDAEGYAVTGSLQQGRQNFIFDEDGSLSDITRSYPTGAEETVLSLRLKRMGRSEDAEHIVDDSLVLEENRIYYLKTEEGSKYPSLLCLDMQTDEIELLSEDVSGYTVQNKNIWYASNGTIVKLEKAGSTDTIQEGTYSVAEADGRWQLQDSRGIPLKNADGYETIEGRVYRLDEGKIVYISAGTPKIGQYTFRVSDGASGKTIQLGDGRDYVQQGQTIDVCAVLGNSLYYSTVINTDGAGLSQIWKIDVYTGKSTAVGGSFEGRVRSMYSWPERNEIFAVLHSSSGNETMLVLSEAGLYSLPAKEEAGAYEPIWAEGNSLYAYRYGKSDLVSGSISSGNGEPCTFDLNEKMRFGTGSVSAEAPMHFGFREHIEETESNAETVPAISEDEMLITVEAPPTEEADTEVLQGAPGLSDEEQDGAQEDVIPAPPAREAYDPEIHPDGRVHVNAEQGDISHGPGIGMTETGPRYDAPSAPLTDSGETVKGPGH